MESPEPLPCEQRSFLTPRVEILRLDFSRLGRPDRSGTIEDRAAEARRIVHHLSAIVREHRASARRIGSPLDEWALHAVFDALRVESLGGDTQSLLQLPTRRRLLRQALFEDLLEVPGLIVMPDARWRDCLRLLEERVSGG